MRLIIGGKGQGKLDFLRQEREFGRERIIDGADCSFEQLENIVVLDHLHSLVRRWTNDGNSLEELYEKIYHAEFIICDEVGSGIVPMLREEEEWRENVGRLCCKLAKEAVTVDRVFCGIPQRIKG